MAMNSLDADAWYAKLQASRRSGPNQANAHWQRRIAKENDRAYTNPRQVTSGQARAFPG